MLQTQTCKTAMYTHNAYMPMCPHIGSTNAQCRNNLTMQWKL